MDQETQALMTQMADEAADKAVKQTLLTIGINYQNPIEVQADMAALRELRVLIEDPEIQRDLMHLRRWRQTMDTVQSKGMLAAVGMICMGGMALILYAFHIKPFGAP